jgi:cellobiose-specific phosphotransferase system component IIB
MSRYVQAEVDDAIVQVERGVFTPHAQIVLAAEVEALRAQFAELRESAGVLVEHIERKYYGTMAPSQRAIEQHSELGRLAIAVWHKLQPSAAEPLP